MFGKQIKELKNFNPYLICCVLKGLQIPCWNAGGFGNPPELKSARTKSRLCGNSRLFDLTKSRLYGLVICFYSR